MSDTITFDEFTKVEMRAGTIQSIEDLPKSKKLIKLTVGFGTLGNRTILAGVKDAFNEGRVIVGQKIVAVMNLAPRDMMGITSHGMVLATHDENDKVWLLNPGPVPDGVEVA